MGHILNKFFSARLLTYLLVLLVVIGSIISIFNRAYDSAWDSMSDVRFNYNLYSLFLSGFGMLVGYGLWTRRTWSRVYAISFAASILLLHVGTMALVLFVTDDVYSIITWDFLLLTSFSLVSLIALNVRDDEFDAK